MECINSKIEDIIEKVRYNYCSINKNLYYKYTILQFTTVDINIFSTKVLYFPLIEKNNIIKIKRDKEILYE